MNIKIPIIGLTLIALVLLAIGSLFIGRAELVSWESAYLLIVQVRIPRILAAILVGGGLGIAGTTYQGVMQNALVSPFVLGASAGAGFGSALAILWRFSPLGIQLMAFIFGNIAVMLAIFLGKHRHDRSGVTLVLAGMIVSSLFSALLSLIKTVADSESRLPSIVFWLLGSLAEISLNDLMWTAFPLCIGSLFLYLTSWKLNIMGLGDDEATRLGDNPNKLRLLMIAVSTLIVSAAISMAGVIGWIGLVIPTIGRMLVGSDFRKLIPFSFLGGAFYLLLVDDITRWVSNVEIPIGILTSLLGAPLFAWLLKSKKTGWN